MSGLSAGKWRLLEKGEITALCDQAYNSHVEGWLAITGGLIGIQITDTGRQIVRRRMTPAEEHAEELLEALNETLSQARRYGPTSRGELGGEYACDVISRAATAISRATSDSPPCKQP